MVRMMGRMGVAARGLAGQLRKGSGARFPGCSSSQEVAWLRAEGVRSYASRSFQGHSYMSASMVPPTQAPQASSLWVLQQVAAGVGGGSQHDQEEELLALSRTPPTPVALSDLYQFGLNGTAEVRLANAQFLHRELAIRLAQRAVELASLPHGLSERESIADVSAWYAAAAFQVHRFDYPKTTEDEKRFTYLIKQLLRDHTAVVRSVALGCMELKEELAIEEWDGIQDSIDEVLSSFYTSRIGVRFLMEQHITSERNSPGFSGIIAKACKPDDVARRAASDATELCLRYHDVAPRVNVVCKASDTTITYVPSHISYMLTELLKNSLRATVDEHPDKHWKEMPPVTVVVAQGDEDVTIRVSDEGGGIRRSRMHNVFSFLHSTAENTAMKQSGSGLHGRRAEAGEMRATPQNTPILAGWGVGLPLSRVYARYFGGDLDIKSMEGFGTDAYLHLNVLGDGCENLPAKVQHSPAARDSTPSRFFTPYNPLSKSDAYSRRDY